jgi:biopolymer transport protein ExbD
MTWSVRHEGSPRSIDGLTVPQIVEGLQDGLWEPTDEVRGPQEHNWTAIENHRQFAEVAANLEPPPPRFHEDETRLDMNPLIDVCLVLLIFFILTTSYAALQKILDMPDVSSQGKKAPLVKTKQQVQQFTIMVEARQENGKPVVRVENEIIDLRNLVPALRRFVKDTRKTELLLDASPEVDWGTVVGIQDAARDAGVAKVHYRVEQGEIR